jgi:predicted Zn-dependent protease
MEANDEKELLPLLMEIGYVACGMGSGQTARARRIFEAVSAARPASEQPWIALGILALNTGAPDEAIRHLRDHALKLNPSSDLAKSFLGLACQKAGYNHESRTHLEEVARTGRDPQAVALATSLLNTT